MAALLNFEYKPQNYVVKFGWNDKISYLLLCYDVDHHFCFVDLERGRILNLAFSTVDEAEQWLYNTAVVYEQNVITTTYIPEKIKNLI